MLIYSAILSPKTDHGNMCNYTVYWVKKSCWESMQISVCTKIWGSTSCFNGQVILFLETQCRNASLHNQWPFWLQLAWFSRQAANAMELYSKALFLPFVAALVEAQSSNLLQTPTETGNPLYLWIQRVPKPRKTQ